MPSLVFRRYSAGAPSAHDALVTHLNECPGPAAPGQERLNVGLCDSIFDPKGLRSSTAVRQSAAAAAGQDQGPGESERRTLEAHVNEVCVRLRPRPPLTWAPRGQGHVEGPLRGAGPMMNSVLGRCAPKDGYWSRSDAASCGGIDGGVPVLALHSSGSSVNRPGCCASATDRKAPVGVEHAFCVPIQLTRSLAFGACVVLFWQSCVCMCVCVTTCYDH